MTAVGHRKHEAPRLLIVHGHFYQPPRENPATGLIERDMETAPDHDWNERISAQCYAPNTSSRILNPSGQVLSVRNNLADISFDMGPTLMTWIEQHRPQVYRRILAADAQSRRQRGGHGNAMAQAHGHMILPLADDHDLRTQLAWGRADFKHRFGREPAGVWLPETAVNTRTADAAIDLGFRLVILAPDQIERVRPAGSGPWHDGANLDVLKTYRLAHSRRPDAHLAVLLFHAPLSRAMAFEGLLTSADRFAEALKGGMRHEGGVLTVATDGETFGHHQPFSDMCLAAMFGSKVGGTGLTPTNPEAALERFAPAHEVELKKGPDGLGTSWSCAHGVSRWFRDCGCQSGGGPGWNQRWREPLRKGLTELSSELKRIYESFASRYFRDPWEARDRFIEVLLDGGSREARERFLADHMKKTASSAARATLVRLLESQRLSMASMTSCGWFFSDVSGVETVGNLRAAARAIELVKDLAHSDLHARLVAHLRKAKSNIAAQGDGAEIYARRVLPAVLDEAGMAARAVMVKIAGDDGLAARTFQVQSLHLDNPSISGTIRGRIEAEDRLTGQRSVYSIEVDMGTLAVTATRSEGSPRRLTPAQLDHDLRVALVHSRLATESRAFDEDCRRAVARAEATMARLVELGMSPSGAILIAARRATEAEIEHLLASGSGAASVPAIVKGYARARALGVAPTPQGAAHQLSIWLERAIARIGPALVARRFDEASMAIDEALAIYDLERDGHVKLQPFEAQNRMYDLLTQEIPAWIDHRSPSEKEQTRGMTARLVELADRLNLARDILPSRLLEKGARPR